MAKVVAGRSARMLLMCALAWAVGCAHQPPAPLPGLEESLLPLFVPDRTSLLPLERGGVGGGSRACGAIFIAPHHLVTSSAVFAGEVDDDDAVIDAGDAFLADGAFSHEIQRIDASEARHGLALVRSSEKGRAVVLRDLPVEVGERLVRIGFSFHRDAGSLRARADWESSPATVVVPSAGGTFVAETALHPGLCGAGLFDLEGRLVGLVVGGGGSRVLVSDAAEIRRVLAEAANGR